MEAKLGKRIKIGILGTANIARRSVIPTLLQLPDHFELVGVAGRDALNTAKYCYNFNISPYHGYDAIINCRGLDAVYVPLPNSLHYEWVMKSLERGLHVMCEKSVSCSLEEAALMVEKARSMNLLLMEHFQFRFHNQLNYIIDLIGQKQIGELRCIRSSFTLPPFSESENIRYSKALGGGALLDAGAYPLKISQILLGNNIRVKAATLNSLQGKEVDILGGAYLEEENSGIFSEIAFGFDHLYQCNLELLGSKGKLTTDRIFTAPDNYEPTIYLDLQQGYEIKREVVKLAPDNHFRNIWVHFFNSIRSDINFETEYQHIIQQAQIIAQIKEKAHER